MSARPTSTALVMLVALLAPRTIATAAETYAADPEHMSIVFSASHAGFSFVYGFFRKAQGGFILDKTNPANCRFRFAIDAGSLDTNHAVRDTHLKGEQFFNVREYPTIQFESTSCKPANSQEGGVVYEVAGNINMHGVTKPVTIVLRQLAEGKSPFDDYRAGFLGNFQLKRSDFKMDSRPDLVGDVVSINISFEGVLQDAASTAARPQ
jgi:polyisoprenoid-binding protein YceI